MAKICLKNAKNIVFERPAKTRRFRTSAGMATFAFESTQKGRRDAEKRRDELHNAGRDVRRVPATARNLDLSAERPQPQIYHLYTRKSAIRGTKKKQKYKYEQASVAVHGSKFLKSQKRYVAPVERKQTQIMEYLTAQDTEIMADAWRRGVAVADLIDYVAKVTGVRVAAGTIYAYFRRHEITRGKRKRSDAGRGTIRLSAVDDLALHRAWRAGESWQAIQKRIQAATGKKMGKSAIYAYFRERGVGRRK